VVILSAEDDAEDTLRPRLEAAGAGTPINMLQEMGGWESAEMVQRYAHLAPEHLLEHAKLQDPILLPQKHLSSHVG